MSQHKPWGKTPQYHQLRPGIGHFSAKVKLDGTNNSIQFVGDRIYQSRNRIITSFDDNYGFAAWATTNDIEGAEGWTVYGEWIGPGILDRTAAGQIDRLVWCVFGAEDPDGRRVFEPEVLETVVYEHPDVFIIPWIAHFDMPQDIEAVNALVQEVEECDPFIRDVFGVEGLGEGIVAVGDDGSIFKAKGARHRDVIQDAPAIKRAKNYASANAFALAVCTEHRFEQAAEGLSTIQDTGAFIKRVVADVHAECAQELGTIDGKMATKAVSRIAAEWWKARVR